MKKIFIFISCLAFLLIVKAASAETINFDLSEFKIDAAKQVILSQNKDTSNSKSYHSFIIPVLCSKKTGLYSVPEKLSVTKIKLAPILTGIKFVQKNEDTLLKNHETYNNLPAAIGASGFSRGNGILNLEFTPFIFRQDTLFFIESLDYELSDYQIPLITNCKAGEEGDLLIIGSNMFSQQLTTYSHFKQQTGLKTEIAFVEDILQTVSGKNNAHKIRNYIKESYRNKNIRFVLLAGGNSSIPVIIFKNSPNDEATPSDQFYSNLDKEFDSNNNGIYADNLDVVDYYPDLQIGRWPVSTVYDMQIIVDKTIRYYSGSISECPNYYQSLALTAFNLESPHDSESFCEAVELASGTGMHADSLYENSTPGFSSDKVYSAFNQGYNIIYVQAHGTLNKFGVRNGWGIFSDHIYYTTSVSGLYYIASCHPGDFAASGMVVKAMLAPLGGCVNYIGTSGSEYPNITKNLHIYNFSQLTAKHTLGNALDYARRTAFPNLMNQSLSRQLYYGYNLQGDPSNYLYMQTPYSNSISDVTIIKRGAGSISGVLTQTPDASVTVSLFSKNKLLASTTTVSNSFSLNYYNLFEDSVVIAISSPDILFKKVSYPTVANNQDLQVKRLTIRDSNNSSFVENMENFKIAVKLNSILNQPLTDSLKIIFKCSSNVLATELADTATIAWPTVGSDIDYELFNLKPDFVNLKSDTSLVFNLQIIPNGTDAIKTQSPIFEKNYLLPLANPRLEISWAKFPDDNTVKPVLVNRSAGKIDQANIKLFGTKFLNTDKETFFILHNINGNALLLDSLQFDCNININQKLEILQNNSPVYYSSVFKKSSENSSDIDTLKTKFYNIGTDLFISWNKYKNNIAYNLFIYQNDTLINIPPVNKFPLTTPEFQYNLGSTNVNNNTYIKIALIDKNTNEAYAVSGFIKINSVPQYHNSPYSLLPFQLFNPVNVDNKIVANTENGAIVSIPADGTGVAGNGSLFQPTSFGFENDFQQGKAFGDINNDGRTDIVNLAYASLDSVYLQVVDLVSGQLLAKKKIYGYAMFNTPVLANIDADSEHELLFSMFNGNVTDSNIKGGYIYAYDYQDGDLILKPGYPIISTNSDYYIGTPTIADLDNNGSKKLVFNCGNFVEVYDLNTLCRIAQFNVGNVITNDVALCDLDNDQKLEIICIQTNCGSANGKLRVLKFTGSSLIDLAGFASGIDLEMQLFNFNNRGPGPIVADLDLDGNPEIIAATGKKLYALKSNGDAYAGFPITLPSSVTSNNINCPSLADLNGDGKLDLIFIDGNSKIHGYNSVNTTVLPGFPLYVPSTDKNNYGSINISDLDQDGDLEILVGARGGNLFVFDYPLLSSDRQIYSYHRADLANSGIFGRTDMVDIADNTNLPSKFAIISQYPNPFNPVTAINFFIPNAENVQFKVFNAVGQLVYQQDKVYSNSGIKRIEFNATDLSSGLYIYSLKYHNEIEIGKCTLLK